MDNLGNQQDDARMYKRDLRRQRPVLLCFQGRLSSSQWVGLRMWLGRGCRRRRGRYNGWYLGAWMTVTDKMIEFELFEVKLSCEGEWRTTWGWPVMCDKLSEVTIRPSSWHNTHSALRRRILIPCLLPYPRSIVSVPLSLPLIENCLYTCFLRSW